ncbi:MAG: DnaA N-terminal domain-containing protein, partial [Microcoleus sp.]|uniref:DnaA N-terminal domain-containing protein n=1 Tax=Microcoleus sp. TaxID=44472 RepID=UPI003C78CAF2
MDIPLENLWNQILERLQVQLSRPSFETWIKTARAEQLENNCLIVSAPNPFARNWLQKYYVKTIASAVEEILGYPVEIYLTIARGNETDDSSQGATIWPSPIADAPESNSLHPPKPANLNPKYVFSRFVVGSNNRMAHAAS